ncbi:DNA-binding protein [Dissulfurispira thermophila]|uniref:DNA-binding protein n=2 Tax=root TaxID=1 RepID=A0A7G1H056_9BACT|nr:PIN domain-containing protein [Dissulfurispira thermophila]BCB96064.1 DNA-binding protein [Dissulfurispira thermophila]
MKRLFVDTGAWYALVDKNDPDHKEALSFIKNNKIPLLTTNFIFDETITLLRSRLGWSVAKEFGQRLKDSRFVSLISVEDEDEEKAWEIFLKYKDKDFSYTDCTSFAVMKRLKIDFAFTFDSHFQTMKFNAMPL